MGLTQRRENILKIIVSEYVTSATPVASENIARNYNLGVSPATIRNEMARLEEEGYIIHPHTSAGGMPSDKGYRYYVECLLGDWLPSEGEQYAIWQLFHQVEQELEEWVRLATLVLAQRLRNIALVTMPRAIVCHLRHFDLVAVEEFLALLILLFQEASLRRHLLTLKEAVSQDELSAIANKLNAAYKGLTCSQIVSQKLTLSSIEQEVKQAVVQIMEAEDKREDEEFCLDGLRHLLGQPEFRDRRMLGLLEALEERSVINNLLSSLGSKPGMKIAIGSENKEQALKECSVVLNSYGVPGKAKGTIGVIGPTRMHYSQVIPTINCLSSVMTELVGGLYP